MDLILSIFTAVILIILTVIICYLSANKKLIWRILKNEDNT